MELYLKKDTFSTNRDLCPKDFFRVGIIELDEELLNKRIEFRGTTLAQFSRSELKTDKTIDRLSVWRETRTSLKTLDFCIHLLRIIHL